MFNKLQKAIVLGVGVFTLGLIQSASADFSINEGKLSVKHKQDIVVTLKSDPFILGNEEQACLAVTFARMLSMNPVNNVTLFVTLDGVELADDGFEPPESDNRLDGVTCSTPKNWSPGGPISLQENLEAFLAGGSDYDMLVCPICWTTRKGEVDSDYGVVPGITLGVPGTAIGTMMGNADKILDF